MVTVRRARISSSSTRQDFALSRMRYGNGLAEGNREIGGRLGVVVIYVSYFDLLSCDVVRSALGPSCPYWRRCNVILDEYQDKVG